MRSGTQFNFVTVTVTAEDEAATKNRKRLARHRLLSYPLKPQNVNLAETCNCRGLNMVLGVPNSALGAGAPPLPAGQLTCPR